jgi:hypothetical protein
MTSFEMGQLIARAWSDEAFKSKLLTKPHEAVKECNIALRAGTSLRVHMNSETELHIVIPAPPAELEISNDESSDQGGGCWLPCRGNNSW